MEEQVADGTIDGPGATNAAWAPDVPDIRAAIRQAARELLRAAPYGSLVLWGGRLVHGLRFTSIAPVSTGFAPAGCTPVVPGLFEQLDVGASPRLVMLAPFPVGRLLGTEDQACRFQVCGPVAADGCEWVSVALAGWVARVPGESVSELALAFTERHPTPDLLDLGSAWMLLEIDLAEATVRTRSGCIRLDTDDALDLLRDRHQGPGRGLDRGHDSEAGGRHHADRGDLHAREDSRGGFRAQDPERDPKPVAGPGGTPESGNEARW
ncbi:hypothetical protein [Parafrankia sp. FMc2]|uniref:hypothetical protein n=1 Tax=Parafrankia sp. FMc2 TaxID=3233196 RepID=UPI0034D647B5